MSPVWPFMAMIQPKSKENNCIPNKTPGPAAVFFFFFGFWSWPCAWQEWALKRHPLGRPHTSTQSLFTSAHPSSMLEKLLHFWSIENYFVVGNYMCGLPVGCLANLLFANISCISLGGRRTRDRRQSGKFSYNFWRLK